MALVQQVIHMPHCFLSQKKITKTSGSIWKIWSLWVHLETGSWWKTPDVPETCRSNLSLRQSLCGFADTSALFDSKHCQSLSMKALFLVLCGSLASVVAVIGPSASRSGLCRKWRVEKAQTKTAGAKGLVFTALRHEGRALGSDQSVKPDRSTLRLLFWN